MNNHYHEDAHIGIFTLIIKCGHSFLAKIVSQCFCEKNNGFTLYVSMMKFRKKSFPRFITEKNYISEVKIFKAKFF